LRYYSCENVNLETWGHFDERSLQLVGGPLNFWILTMTWTRGLLFGVKNLDTKPLFAIWAAISFIGIGRRQSYNLTNNKDSNNNIINTNNINNNKYVQ
jgi:hypothetical protein